jgi:hypothetical protein
LSPHLGADAPARFFVGNNYFKFPAGISEMDAWPLATGLSPVLESGAPFHDHTCPNLIWRNAPVCSFQVDRIFRGHRHHRIGLGRQPQQEGRSSACFFARERINPMID